MTPINMFTVTGTGQTPTSTSNGHNFTAQVAAQVNQSLFNIIPVPYPATVPFNTSAAAGVNTLFSLMSANPGPFVLVGYSQGAMVVDAALKTNPPNLIGGVTFGNPQRQRGHTFPNCPDPGGHGIMSAPNLLTNTPVSWWDFAHPSDLAACVFSNVTGQWLTLIFMAACESFTGDMKVLLDTLRGAPLDIINLAFQLIPYFLPQQGNVPHTSYAEYVPFIPGPKLLVNSNKLTCVQLAVQYLNTL
jgi:hypothetical protein